MTRSLIESTALSTVSLVSRCPKQFVQRLHSLTMVDDSKSPSPDKLSPLPEGESLLSQPVLTLHKLQPPLIALTN